MNDLETRLRRLVDTTATVRPNMDEVIAHGRRFRWRRLAVTAAAATAMVAMTTVAAVTLMIRTLPEPSVVLTAPPSPPPETESSDDDTVSLRDVPLPLGVIDDAGLHPNALADVPALDGPVTTAFADGEGGVVYQRADRPRTIHWRRASGRDDRYDVEPGPTTLFGVVSWKSAPHVVWGAAVPRSETPLQTVRMYRGEGETFQTVSTDLIVELVEGVGLTDDGRVVISTCHLLCQLAHRRPRPPAAGHRRGGSRQRAVRRPTAYMGTGQRSRWTAVHALIAGTR
ncbi:MAG: hypothetical protein GEU74_12060 [Nitriliruptorales bacterium]|nr:hypothetical protein [Nitriliruptorales bacterium]